MPTAWRIVKAQHAAAALDGEGARRFGGRWNSPGVSVVYASDSRALATLEVLVGLRATAALAQYLLIPLVFEESLVTSLRPLDLPDDWDQNPPSTTSQRLGDGWVAQGASPLLRVPSVIVPQESNFLLNPRHPHFSKVRVGEPEPLKVDPRLMG
jgi:RES domain-containing protein